MAEELYYLKPNVIAEPLVFNWYATPFLTAPHTAAMFFKNKLFKIMESYIEKPEFHENSLKKRALTGGPFIRFSTRDVHAVESLYKNCLAELSHLLELAQAIETVNTMLDSLPRGAPLEPLYPDLPTAIKGYIELVYDLQNRANFRFFESLLYKSTYNLHAQQSVLLTLGSGDGRDYVLNTPRVRPEDKWKIKRPFSDSLYDLLFKSRYTPINKETIRSIFLKDESAEILAEILKKFFSQDKPTPTVINAKPTDGIRVRYFGHACVLLESNEISVLIDPVISYSYPNTLARYTHLDLPEKIDYLLITHTHHDHTAIEHLLQIRHKVDTVIVPASNGGFLQDLSLKELFKHLGFNNIVTLSEMEDIPIVGGKITAIPFLGEHGDFNVRSKTGYCVEIQNMKVWFAADSNNLCPELYSIIKKTIGTIDVIFLGMECDGCPSSWVYGPIMAHKPGKEYDQSRRVNGSDFQRGRTLIDIFNCSHLYIYALAQEPWVRYLLPLYCDTESIQYIDSDKMINYCHSQGKIAKRLYGKDELEFVATKLNKVHLISV